MPLRTPCPSCDHILSVPRTYSGRMLRCPMCETRFELPRTGPPKLKREREEISTPPLPPPVSAAQPEPAALADTADGRAEGAVAIGRTGNANGPTPPPLARSRSRGEVDATQAEVESVTDALSTRGYEHNADKCWTVYYLATALAVAAVFGIVPAVLDVIQHFQSVNSTGISRWAWILFLLSGIQLSYAVFLFQLPDWASVRVVSIVTLGFSTGYAMLLGLLLLANGQSQVIRFLELTDQAAGNHATGWCLIMLSISILLAYFSGRIGTAWHRAYRLATENAATGGASAAD